MSQSRGTSIRQTFKFRNEQFAHIYEDSWMSLDTVRRSSRLTSNSSGVKNQNMSEKSKKDAKGDPKGDARDRRESLSHSKSAPCPDADSFKKDISVMIAETRLSMKFNELENKVTKTMNDFRVEMREEMKKVNKEIDDTKKNLYLLFLKKFQI